MEKFEVRPATRVSATQLAPILRPADVLEVWRASGMRPLDALLDSIALSDEDMCWVATKRGHPVAMFGASPLSTDGEDTIGGIWLLASHGIYTNKLDFMRQCKRHLAIMHTRYKFLTNFIDADNLPTQVWLPRLGFRPCLKVDEFGFGKTPFIQYVSERK